MSPLGWMHQVEWGWHFLCAATPIWMETGDHWEKPYPTKSSRDEWSMDSRLLAVSFDYLPHLPSKTLTQGREVRRFILPLWGCLNLYALSLTIGTKTGGFLLRHTAYNAVKSFAASFRNFFKFNLAERYTAWTDTFEDMRSLNGAKHLLIKQLHMYQNSLLVPHLTMPPKLKLLYQELRPAPVRPPVNPKMRRLGHLVGINPITTTREDFTREILLLATSSGEHQGELPRASPAESGFLSIG